MSMRPLLLAASGLVLAGCATYYPVETTPEGILGSVSSGDTVRIRTRDAREITLLVWRLDEYEVSGWLDGGDSKEIGRVSYDRIDTIGVERLNLRKAMLTTLVPVVVGAIIFCNNEDCATHSGVTASF